jgi:hypothetical protein
MCPFANLDPNFGPMLKMLKCCKYLTQFEAVSSTFFFLGALYARAFEMPYGKYVLLRKSFFRWVFYMIISQCFSYIVIFQCYIFDIYIVIFILFIS